MKRLAVCLINWETEIERNQITLLLFTTQHNRPDIHLD